MLKKIIFSLLALLPCCLVAQTTGTWRVHATFNASQGQNIIDTGDQVYYLASNNLFRYNKTTQENEALNAGNYLSDGDIRQIYYNTSKKYILVAYEDANIDIIEANGDVVNMPEIKNAELTSSRGINDVTFNGSRAYVATDFGYVVLNDEKYEVSESRIYNVALNSAAIVGDYMLLTSGSTLYYGSASERHSVMSEFSTAALESACKLRPVNSTTCLTTDGYVHRIVFSGGKPTISTVVYSTSNNLQATPSGYVANFTGKSYYYTFDSNGLNETRVEGTEGLLSAYPSGNGTFWVLDSNGVHEMGSTSYLVPNASNVVNPFYLVYNDSQDKLFVSNTGPIARAPNQSDHKLATGVNTLSGTSWTDVTPSSDMRTMLRPVFDPQDPSTYYAGSWYSGIFKVTDGKLVKKFDNTNSPLVAKSSIIHGVCDFDKSGNLWIVQGSQAGQAIVLPRSVLTASSTTTNDGYTHAISNLEVNQRGQLIGCKHNSSSQYNNIMVYADGDYEMPVVAWNSSTAAGKPSATGYFAKAVTDQDGSSISYTYIYALAEDLNGEVWVGHASGIFTFDPADLFSSNFRVNHIKVPRNDGTNLADYLLDGIQVNSIAVDASNRKWIGTENSGLFLVSADGTSIIQQFTSANSVLPDNTIYQVETSTDGSSVYVTTPTGIYEYLTHTTSTGEGDYGEMYASPNPVRPDYSGTITIHGAGDDSVVKITDSSGNVIVNLRSSDGIATWDGCNAVGDQVPSGVYFVFSSPANSSSTTSSSKTKILIMR